MKPCHLSILSVITTVNLIINFVTNEIQFNIVPIYTTTSHSSASPKVLDGPFRLIAPSDSVLMYFIGNKSVNEADNRS